MRFSRCNKASETNRTKNMRNYLCRNNLQQLQLRCKSFSLSLSRFVFTISSCHKVDFLMCKNDTAAAQPTDFLPFIRCDVQIWFSRWKRAILFVYRLKLSSSSPSQIHTHTAQNVCVVHGLLLSSSSPKPPKPPPITTTLLNKKPSEMKENFPFSCAHANTLKRNFHASQL